MAIAIEAETIRSYVKDQIALLKDFQGQAEEVGDARPLFSEDGEDAEDSLELDSLDAVELALALETEFNLGVPEDLDIKRFRTVDEIVEFVIDLLSQDTAVDG